MNSSSHLTYAKHLLQEKMNLRLKMIHTYPIKPYLPLLTVRIV